MAVLYLDSGSINNLTVGNSLSNATAVSAQTASLNVAIQGGISTQVSQLVFSSANNISFGLAGNTLTALYSPPAISYYENIPAIQNLASFAFSSNTNFIQPFAIPYNLSLSYIRVLLSNAFVSTTFATAAGTNTYGVTQGNTWWANIYTQGTGANTSLLQLLAQSSATMEIRGRFDVSGATNSQFYTYSITYPVTGSTASTAVNTQSSLANVNIATGQLSNFNSNRFLDIPFATSISQGQYWIAFARSSTTATAGSNLMSNWRYNNSNFGVSQINSSFANMGTTAASPLQIGLGSFSVNAGTTTSTVTVSNISSAASQPKIPFQMVRFV
jgi:hypothetical protein